MPKSSACSISAFQCPQSVAGQMTSVGSGEVSAVPSVSNAKRRLWWSPAMWSFSFYATSWTKMCQERLKLHKTLWECFDKRCRVGLEEKNPAKLLLNLEQHPERGQNLRN